MPQLNVFEIWVKPTCNNNGGIISLNYFFKPNNGITSIPLLLHYLLKKCCEEDNLPQGVESNFFSNGYYPIKIVLHSAQDILKGQASNSAGVCDFAQAELKHETDLKVIYPLVHITLPDLFIHSFYGTEGLPKPVPRSYMIMDNSIWNYLVPITGSYYIRNLSLHYKNRNNKSYKEWQLFFESTKKETDDGKTNYLFQPVETCLRKALISICNNYSKQLYRLKVAREYADLNARLTHQSFLSGAHASGVAPFIFHSESCTKNLIKREFRSDNLGNLPDSNKKYNRGSLIERLIKNRKWRILLLDDRALNPMESIPLFDDNVESSDNEKGGWNCKLTIIQNILEYQLDLEGKVEYRPYKFNEETRHIPDEKVILVEYAQSLREAEDALSNKKYDLVLLDYLLNQADGIHYGYELLEDIWDDQQQHRKDKENLRFKILPHRSQRLYCMFISAYSSAVHDRLLAEGLNQSEDYWFINLGACPTNTPQLFLYNLLKLMDKRLEDSGILKLSSDNIYKLINKIFRRKEDDPKRESVRKRANAYYQKVLSLQYHYRSILRDVEIPFGQNSSIFDTKGSVLMTDFIQNKINLGGMLEHLTQLVHLTAFGTVRQWPEMWEEYIYFKAQFEKQISEEKGLDNVDAQDLRDLFSDIEKHILDLKSQQQ